MCTPIAPSPISMPLSILLKRIFLEALEEPRKYSRPAGTALYRQLVLRPSIP